MLTVLVSTISNSQVFCWKNVSSFCECKRYSHFFTKNISVYAVFNDQSFNDTLTNDIVSFEQLGPDLDNKVPLKPKGQTLLLLTKRSMSLWQSIFSVVCDVKNYIWNIYVTSMVDEICLFDTIGSFSMLYVHQLGQHHIHCNWKQNEHDENMLTLCWPLKPHFYIVKLGFTRVYIIFLI